MENDRNYKKKSTDHNVHNLWWRKINRFPVPEVMYEKQIDHFLSYKHFH